MFASERAVRKPDQRAAARHLRRDEGASIRAIAERLGLSPSTVHGWTRDIELSAKQREAIRSSDAMRRARRTGNRVMRSRARQKRLAAQNHGRELARQQDPLHVAGCMLYWAEGSKRRNDLEFTNSDPDMIETFLDFLRRCYGVTQDNLRFTLNVHLNNGLDLTEIEAWWLTRLGLSRSCLGSHTVNHYSRASGKTRRGLPYGTARVVVHSTFIVQSIYGAIQEYAGSDRPEWVDL